MNRRRYLAACGAGLTALAGCNAPVVDDGTTDPNTGLPVESAARVVDDPVASGDAALQLFINGLQDDGTIWAQQAARFDEVDTLSVSVHSPEESFNTITRLAVYAGPRPERGWLRESDFDTQRAIEDRAGWSRYEYEMDAEDVGIVAVGISVVWETEVARTIDDVTLS